MSQEIDVWVGEGGVDVRAGRCYSRRRRGAESASFAYDEGYLARPEAYPLDPVLPLVSGTQHTALELPLFGAFGDSAPDRWGRSLIQRAERSRAREAGTAARDIAEIDYLLGVRDDLRQGALRFSHGDDDVFLAPDSTGVPALADLGELLDLATKAENDRAGYEELSRLVRAGSSLGGARPKAHVRGADGRLAIAKFPSANSDTWNVMAWEKVALELARAAGVVVPASRLVRVARRHVLVIDRFDRSSDGHRIGYASAMTMLEARDGEQRSYLEIAEVIEEKASSATADLQQLWRRMALSILISNTDDHLRNHGFLHTGGGAWNLAPAFDLNPNPQPGPTYLSTAIDQSETLASVDLLVEVADCFRVAPVDARRVLDEVAAAVLPWRDVARRHGLDAREIADMAPAFETVEAVAQKVW